MALHQNKNLHTLNHIAQYHSDLRADRQSGHRSDPVRNTVLLPLECLHQVL